MRLHVNSGGNSIAAESALLRAGYTVPEDGELTGPECCGRPGVSMSVVLKVRPTADPQTVATIAQIAADERLGYRADAVIHADQDGHAVLLHVNSGDNSLAAERELRYAGYAVEVGYGERGVRCCQAPGVVLTVVPRDAR